MDKQVTSTPPIPGNGGGGGGGVLVTCTVKPAVAVTSIKRDPPLSGHFRVPPNDFECKCTSIKRAPVQRGQRSAKFAPKR